MMLLCQTDGGIIAVNRGTALSARLSETRAREIATLAELSQWIECGELRSRFEAFTASEKAAENYTLSCGSREYRVELQKLDDGQGRQMILVKLRSGGDDDEQGHLLEAGRMISRLIHDFKNQMGGLKLYAAYLKKRFADQPEGLEIAEKIVQGLNAMAEQAALVSRLTRPLELKREPVDLAALVGQVISDQEGRTLARNLKIKVEIAKDLPHAAVDLQHLRGALGSILRRALDSSVEGGTVLVNLQLQDEGLRIEITDQCEMPGERQWETFFDPLAGDRINSTALDLALARRIIERHGGEVSVLAASTVGTIVRVTLKG